MHKIEIYGDLIYVPSKVYERISVLGLLRENKETLFDVLTAAAAVADTSKSDQNSTLVCCSEGFRPTHKATGIFHCRFMQSPYDADNQTAFESDFSFFVGEFNLSQHLESLLDGRESCPIHLEFTFFND